MSEMLRNNQSPFNVLVDEVDSFESIHEKFLGCTSNDNDN